MKADPQEFLASGIVTESFEAEPPSSLAEISSDKPFPISVTKDSISKQLVNDIGKQLVNSKETMSIRPLPTEDSSSCSRVYDENSSTTQLSLAEDSTSSPGPLVDNSPSAHLALAPDRIGLDRKGKEDK